MTCEFSLLLLLSHLSASNEVFGFVALDTLLCEFVGVASGGESFVECALDGTDLEMEQSMSNDKSWLTSSSTSCL